jgi:hypothetical protein
MELDEECGCGNPTSIKELCPKCRAEYEDYLTTTAMLRKSVANAAPEEVHNADAA